MSNKDFCYQSLAARQDPKLAYKISSSLKDYAPLSLQEKSVHFFDCGTSASFTNCNRFRIFPSSFQKVGGIKDVLTHP